MTKKYVYTFGGSKTEGDGSMKNLLGGKGANLAEMANLGLPVPPGFTVTTECCVDYFKNGNQLPKGVEDQVKAALEHIENVMGMKFGDPENPLLVSCRSGARSSMPGMMETVLNVGLASSPLPAPACILTGNMKKPKALNLPRVKLSAVSWMRSWMPTKNIAVTRMIPS